MTENFIELANVEKRYGSTVVLRDINLAIKKHEVVTLIGASGSGKSTLLRCVNGLEAIHEWQIKVAGDVVSGPGVDLVGLRRVVGMVFQSYNLFPHMSVIENCIIAPVSTGLCSEDEAIERADKMLNRVGLSTRARAYPAQLSGGQQQRVAIARAMLMSPQVLLLDEITSALDPELVAEVLDLVRELASDGMTLILTTHEMAFAREISDTLCFLHHSRILERGSPEQIFGSPKAPETKAFLRSLTQAGRI